MNVNNKPQCYLFNISFNTMHYGSGIASVVADRESAAVNILRREGKLNAYPGEYIPTKIDRMIIVDDVYQSILSEQFTSVYFTNDGIVRVDDTTLATDDDNVLFIKDDGISLEKLSPEARQSVKDAAAALPVANTAKSTADLALAKSVTAVDTSDLASTKAEEAIGQSSQALSKSEIALSKSEEAFQKIENAEALAASAEERADIASAAAQSVNSSVDELKTAIEELPDGQAVTAKVAEHTTKLTDLEREIFEENIDPIIENANANASGSRAGMYYCQFNEQNFSGKAVKVVVNQNVSEVIFAYNGGVTRYSFDVPTATMEIRGVVSYDGFVNQIFVRPSSATSPVKISLGVVSGNSSRIEALEEKVTSLEGGVSKAMVKPDFIESDFNKYFEGLYIEGLDPNTQYCLRTLRYLVNEKRYQVNIGTASGNVLELAVNANSLVGYGANGTMRAFCRLANVNTSIGDSIIYMNTDINKAKVNIAAVSNVMGSNAALLSRLMDVKMYSSANFVHSKYANYDASTNKVSIVDWSSDSFAYIRIEVNKGDLFTISTTGGNNARAYAFVGTDGLVKSVASPSQTLVNFDFRATEKGVLYVNCTSAGYANCFIFHYQFLDSKVDELADGKGVEGASIPSYNGYALPKNPSSLKVLFIGNSFVDQPMQALTAYLSALNINNAVVGKVIYAGCSLQKYWEDYENGNAVYGFSVSTNGSDFVTISSNALLKTAFEYTDWDVVTFQQNSANSGIYSTISPYLGKLVQALRYHCPNAGVKVGWQQTWAYANGYSELSAYGNSQAKMFDGIVDVSKRVVVDFGIDLVIPNGIVMQHLRSIPSSFWGGNLVGIKGEGGDHCGPSSSSATGYGSGDFCADGLHPMPLANYALCGTFVQMIMCACFNKTIKGTTAYYGWSGDYAKIARQCVLKAIGNRFALSTISTSVIE